MKQHTKDVSRVQSLLKNEFLHNNSNPSKVDDERFPYFNNRMDTPIFGMDNHFMPSFDNLQGHRNSTNQQGNNSNTNFSPPVPFSSMLGTPGQQSGGGMRNHMFNPLFPPASPILQMGMFGSESNTPMMNMFDFMNKNQTQNQMPNSNSIVLANGLHMNPLRGRSDVPANSNQDSSAIQDTSGYSGGNCEQLQQKAANNSLLSNNLTAIPEEGLNGNQQAGEQAHTNTTTLSSPPSNTNQFNPQAPNSFSSSLPPSAHLFSAPNVHSHHFGQNPSNFMQGPFSFNTSSIYPTSLFGYNNGLDYCFDETKMLKGQDQLGSYSREERMQRILKYKNKIQKWRDAHPVNRAFTGRSKVAGNKPRFKGRFVKASEYDKLKAQEEREEAPTQLTSEMHGGHTPEKPNNTSMQIETPIFH
jgi:hypothetical protein